MSFEQGLSGLSAASKSLDVIGNNVANANTVGFKESQAQFADVYANSLNGSGNAAVGIGTTVSAVSQQFSQGNISTTNNPLDLAINGQGFFRLDNSGSISYTRNGQFQLDKSGYVVNSEGARLTGYAANSSGVLDTAAPSDLQVASTDSQPHATATVDATLNLDATDTQPPTSPFSVSDPNTYNNSTSVSAFDSLGNSHTLSLYFAKTATSGTWDVYAAVDGSQVGTGTVGTLTFDTSGALSGTGSMPLSMTLTNGATTPQNLTLDFSGSTQYGSPFGVDSMSQDGYTSGHLSGLSVASDGTIQGRYTNGQSAVLGQVTLSNFSDPQSLQPIGSNAWAQTSSSGSPVVGVPGSGTLGVLQSSAVENSNVDLTTELVNMITAQYVYQANAQSIKTQNQVLQTLVNL